MNARTQMYKMKVRKDGRHTAYRYANLVPGEVFVFAVSGRLRLKVSGGYIRLDEFSYWPDEAVAGEGQVTPYESELVIK